MASYGKFFLLLIWCSTCLLGNADAQGFLYKNKDITQYEIRNGKYKIVTSTTPAPSLMETFFPWTGNAYNSVRTPEEDAALINSLSDFPDSPPSSSSGSSDGLMSWLPSIPSFGGSSAAPPSTGAAANSIFGGPPPSMMGAPPPPPGYPYGGPPPPQGPYPGPPPMNYNGPPPPMMGAASINQPIYVPPPGQENQLGMPGPPPPGPPPPGGFEQYPPFMDYPPPPPGQPMMDFPPSQLGMPLEYPPPSSGQPMMDYPPPPPGQPMMDYPLGMSMDYPPPPPGQQMMDYPPPSFGMPFNDYPPPPPPGHMLPPPPSPQQYPPPPPQQMPNFDPTFQFHQQMKDSLPLPNPSVPGFGQPQFPFPYTTGANLVGSVKNATAEKPAESYYDMLVKYLTFGKRSDIEEVVDVIQERSDLGDAFSVETANEQLQKVATDLKFENISKDSKDADNLDKLKESQDSTDGKYFPCPKGGIWRWNGEVCIAVGPVPIWACKPNDMIVSGKLAICKNKIYFSPKVINTMHRENENVSEII